MESSAWERNSSTNTSCDGDRSGGGGGGGETVSKVPARVQTVRVAVRAGSWRESAGSEAGSEEQNPKGEEEEEKAHLAIPTAQIHNGQY